MRWSIGFSFLFIALHYRLHFDFRKLKKKKKEKKDQMSGKVSKT